MSLLANSRQRGNGDACDLGAGEMWLLPHLHPELLSSSAWQPCCEKAQETQRPLGGITTHNSPEGPALSQNGCSGPRYERPVEASLAASGQLLEVVATYL